MRGRALALVAAAAVALGACGDDADDSATTATAGPTATQAAAGETGLRISTDLSAKPEVPEPSGEPPQTLVSDDVVVGDGRTARAGDNVVVHYVGVLHDGGEQFDASWDSGRPFNFTLGQGRVIPGWDQGVVGMKVGGRRVLVIPPDLAYGETGQGSIPPGATLVFVVDLLNANPA